jgi:hypothetical protein
MHANVYMECRCAYGGGGDMCLWLSRQAAKWGGGGQGTATGTQTTLAFAQNRHNRVMTKWQHLYLMAASYPRTPTCGSMPIWR